VVIIPARMGSKRLPGKMLALVDGLPLVVHVMRRAARAECVSRVIVATADAEIARAVEEHGGEVWMTRADHPTGTDRVAEVAAQLSTSHIINVQGDNLRLDPATVDAVVRELERTGAAVVTPVSPFPSGMDLADPSRVKVVCGSDGRALSFSRQPPRDGSECWLHIGVYGFRRDVLVQFAGWAPSVEEKSEHLEQLRLLAHGIEIDTVQVATNMASIDTPKDLAEARSTSALQRH